MPRGFQKVVFIFLSSCHFQVVWTDTSTHLNHDFRQVYWWTIINAKENERTFIPAGKMYFSVLIWASRLTIIAKINGLISVSWLDDLIIHFGNLYCIWLEKCIFSIGRQTNLMYQLGNKVGNLIVKQFATLHLIAEIIQQKYSMRNIRRRMKNCTFLPGFGCLCCGMFASTITLVFKFKIIPNKNFRLSYFIKFYEGLRVDSRC